MANFKLAIRTARQEDIPRLVELDRKIYGDFGTAVEGSISRRVQTFSPGVIIAEEDGVLRAAVYLRPLPKAVSKKTPLTWLKAENNGDFTPPDNFQHIYGVGFVATGGMSEIMTMAAMRQCILMDVTEGFFGSRIPTLQERFNTRPDQSTVAEYVDSGEDWEIKMYGKASPLGLNIARDKDGKPVVIPDYFDDPESYDYGVLWIWTNRWRGKLKYLGWLWFTILMTVELFYIKTLEQA